MNRVFLILVVVVLCGVFFLSLVELVSFVD